MFLMVIETKFHIKSMPLEIGSGDELGTIIFVFFLLELTADITNTTDMR